MSIFRRELSFAELGWETGPGSPVSSGLATPASDAIEIHRARGNNQQKVRSLINKNGAISFLLDTHRMKNEELKNKNKELSAHLTAVSSLVPLVARSNSYPASEEEMGMIEEEVFGPPIRDDFVQTQISIHPNGQVTMMVAIGVEDTNKRCTWHSFHKKVYNVDGPSLWRGDRKGLPYYFADLNIVDYGERREIPDDIARLLKSSFICTVLLGGFYNLEVLISLLEAVGVQCITNQ
ncbi:hypothetical protein Aduo_006190 [Ancylostoma duodenale]